MSNFINPHNSQVVGGVLSLQVSTLRLTRLAAQPESGKAGIKLRPQGRPCGTHVVLEALLKAGEEEGRRCPEG